ncbi:hypothetical protein SAMN04487884_10889 [Butyrivibrio fibrisolvens]|uniref:Uncharacterized protein n=1 Tax=Butyrivibrio fibrisolvens TaxID=831 RepID=A0A1H9QRK5_BUTFI|nr:hypothetical protein [Butyrivibrio fibrisolvens]SER62865.1 hypothetical protein SAMN04487884_10889 [Butyrivibrio fibrisolvens]
MTKESLYKAMNGIDDEIIFRNGKENISFDTRKSNRKPVIKIIAAIAAATLIFGGLNVYKPWQRFEKKDGASNTPNTGVSDDTTSEHLQASDNMFVITANAAEPIPKEQNDPVSSGDVLKLSSYDCSSGIGGYLSGRFMISGENIANVKISTDKCQIFAVVPVGKDDPEYKELRQKWDYCELGLDYDAVYADDDLESTDDSIDHFDHFVFTGETYEGAYDNTMSFGMYLTDELTAQYEDIWDGYDYHKACYDLVDGATLTISVTFTDGSIEEHHYRVTTGSIYVPVDEDGYCQYDDLTRFITPEEEESEQVARIYGYLMEKID